ncbi:MAG: DUF4258 domain-containing protein [Myxococcota bacterium]|nr:DUF4258 domain-containing protein [Myxococcota bacterium]
MSLSLSLHARQRMHERNISLAEVRACVASGEPLRAKPGQVRVHLRGVVVVHDGRAVITVFRRPSLAGSLYSAGLRWSLADKLSLALESL